LEEGEGKGEEDWERQGEEEKEKPSLNVAGGMYRCYFHPSSFAV
jgi:hypothetical protein